MEKLIKNWALKFLFLFLIPNIIILFLIFINFKNLFIYFWIIFGFIVASILFFIFGFLFNKKIVNKILRLNEIVKSFLPKDVLNRNLYSDVNEEDELEILCDDVENIMFELKTSERVKNDFISSMSHELRTPLTAIKGWAETMKMGDSIDFSTVRRGLDIIIKEVKRLSGIVDAILDFSVVDSGRMVLNKEKIDILAEVEDAVYIFKEQASVEQKKLIYNEPNVPLYVYGDKSKLKQVFINIIDNALKYTKANDSIGVNVSEKNDKILIEITDNGCGIAKSEIPNVTQKFFKANSAKGGFGIGLAIVKEIIYSHNGTLKILSEKGVGTSVIISLNKIEDKSGN